ncbi:DNA repair protein XRCC3-like [Halichondria panicea]|uniref:DNA repair protein XRCC3-like n=1 Tax=Halichondria panicea TaxID=6063 RepID=UPI00312BBEA4
MWWEIQRMKCTSNNTQEKPISLLNVHPRIISAFHKAGLHKLTSVLTLSAGDLRRRTGLSRLDVQGALEAASKAAFPQYAVDTTVLKMYENKDSKAPVHLSTGCPRLNSFLGGGLLVSALNEVAGTSAAGKTQFCLQLCLTVQLPRDQGGLDGGAVYVCTEDAFPHKRLQQMVEAFAKKSGRAPLEISDKIFVEHAVTISSLSVQLQYKLPSLLTQHNIKLVVVDSMAALFRVEFSEAQSPQRAQLLRAFGAQLKKLSNEFSAALVCVNQVTAAIDEECVGGVKPALGLAWAEQVTVRLMMTRSEGVGDETELQQNATLVLRDMEVLFAPHLPKVTTQYFIDKTGVHGDEHITSP